MTRVRELPPGIADREALFDALAEALSFPDYFGRNWDAVADCLSDAEPTVLRVDAALWDAAPELARELVDIWSETEGQEIEFVRREP